MIRYMRWQVLIAFVGIALMLAMLNDLSQDLQTLVLPEAGGAYVEGIPARPGNLNPFFLQTRADQDVAGLLFNRLTRASETGQIVPELAREWEVSEDSRQYTFHLRSNVLWHDGEPLTAEDVAYTIGVIKDPAFRGDPALIELWSDVEVEVVDALTIRVTLPSSLVPFAPFLSSTATFDILPAHILAETPVAALADARFSRQPVGTGPWRLAQIEADQFIFEPNPLYFAHREPMLDRLILRFYDGYASTLQAYQRGEVMGIAQIRPEDVERVLANPSLNLYPTTIPGYTALFFNLQDPLFQEQPLREALMLGLNRQGLIDEVLEGQGIVADGFLMPTHWAYDPNLPRYPFQPDEARALLNEAGWRDSNGDGVRDKADEPLQFTITTDRANPTLVALAEAIATQWNLLGIRVEPQFVDLSRRQRPENFDLLLLATAPGGLPADPDFYPLWHSSQVDGGQNLTGFADEAADQLLVEGRRNLDPEVRRQYYNAFQEMLAEQLPALPLYHPIYNYAVGNLVQQVQVGPFTRASDRFRTLPDWYIHTSRVVIEQDDPTPTPAPTR
jgi:peptide/nickel transport system substrate-binding protein